MNFRKKLGDNQVGFQMAPMVDVMFLLLIFFMVASIYAQWENRVGIEVPFVETGVNSSRMPAEIIINVDEEGHYYINDIEQGIDEVEEVLVDVVSLYKSQSSVAPSVIIRGDGNAKHKKIMLIMDRCRKVGISNISFTTQPLDGE